MRTPIIVGNWKMNKIIDEALTLVKEIHYGLPTAPEAEIIVAPTFTALNKVAEFLQNSFIAVATSFSAVSLEPTSAITDIALPPAFLISSAVSSALLLSELTLFTTRLQPSLAMAKAKALPKPLPEPVTIATFPSNFPI